MATESPLRTDPRDLISTALFGRLVRRIVADEEIDRAMAERIMSQALAFLKACADNPGAGLSPSPTVDIGWHTFILYTKEYAAFCDRVAGRFIHHEPTDDAPAGAIPCCDEPIAHNSEPLADAPAPAKSGRIATTLAAMRASGLPVDEKLWRVSPAKCSQCYAGCADSPKVV
ncbi:hypothetical protein HKK74_36540 [Actinomadura alba]|uniref:Uncharacterized protein n=1 Tax=Actinomadura alba TaxID=406431 RepID=A0ABR7M1G2_9ACTN|nr:hypothetical protein [Actinomadura alba]